MFDSGLYGATASTSLDNGVHFGHSARVRWIIRVTAPVAVIALMVLASCSDSASSPSSRSSITPVSADVPADVVFETDAFIDASTTWTGPLPLTVQQQTASGSWVTVRTVDGPLTSLASLPDGDYRLWDFDVLLGHFSVTRS